MAKRSCNGKALKRDCNGIALQPTQTSDTTEDMSNETTTEPQKCKRYFTPWEDSDVILLVDDQKFHCHSLVLRMNSPVFDAMLLKRGNGRKIIELPDKEGTTFLQFLNLLYPLSKEREPTSSMVKFLIYF